MRAVSIHPDVLVITSRMWQTNAIALRAGDEAMLIDSPYFSDELEALPGLLAGAGFEPDALLATHADFDHLLGRLAFPGLALGLGESSVERLHRDPGEAQRMLRDHDDQYYVERPSPLALGQVQATAGARQRRARARGARAAPGRGPYARRPRGDGALVWRAVPGRLPVEGRDPDDPTGGSLTDYRSTLARLAPLVEAADTVVPGHGAPNGREDTLRILEEDVDYLDALERREEKPALPKGRDSGEQRDIHARNLRVLG